MKKKKAKHKYLNPNKNNNFNIKITSIKNIRNDKKSKLNNIVIFYEKIFQKPLIKKLIRLFIIFTSFIGIVSSIFGIIDFISLNDNDAIYSYNIGLDFMDDENYEKALIYLKKAYNINPNLLEIKYYYCICIAETENPKTVNLKIEQILQDNKKYLSDDEKIFYAWVLKQNNSNLWKNVIDEIRYPNKLKDYTYSMFTYLKIISEYDKEYKLIDFIIEDGRKYIKVDLYNPKQYFINYRIIAKEFETCLLTRRNSLLYSEDITFYIDQYSAEESERIIKKIIENDIEKITNSDISRLNKSLIFLYTHNIEASKFNFNAKEQIFYMIEGLKYFNYLDEYLIFENDLFFEFSLLSLKELSKDYYNYIYGYNEIIFIYNSFYYQLKNEEEQLIKLENSYNEFIKNQNLEWGILPTLDETELKIE